MGVSRGMSAAERHVDRWVEARRSRPRPSDGYILQRLRKSGYVDHELAMTEKICPDHKRQAKARKEDGFRTRYELTSSAEAGDSRT